MRSVGSALLAIAFAAALAVTAAEIQVYRHLFHPTTLFRVLEDAEVYAQLPTLISFDDTELSEGLAGSPFAELTSSQIQALFLFTFPPEWTQAAIERLVTQLYRVLEQEVTLRDIDLTLSLQLPKQRFNDYTHALLTDLGAEEVNLPDCTDDQTEEFIQAYLAQFGFRDAPVDAAFFTEAGCWPGTFMGTDSTFYVLRGGTLFAPEMLSSLFPDALNLFRLIQTDEGEPAITFATLPHADEPLTEAEYERLTFLEEQFDEFSRIRSMLRISIAVTGLIALICLVVIILLWRHQLRSLIGWLAVAAGSSGALLCAVSAGKLGIDLYPKHQQTLVNASPEMTRFVEQLLRTFTTSVFLPLAVLGAAFILTAIALIIMRHIIIKRG